MTDFECSPLQNMANAEKEIAAILHIVNRSGGDTMRYLEALIHSPVMPYRQFVWYVGQHQHVLFDVKNNDYRAFSAQLSPVQQQNVVLNLIARVGVNELGLHLHSFSGDVLAVAEFWTILPIVATFHDHHFLGETPFVDGALHIDEAHIKRVRTLLHDAKIIVPSQHLYRQALPYFDEEKLHVIAPDCEPSKQIQQNAKHIIDTPKSQTMETMTLKTAHYYQQKDIEDLLQTTLSAVEINALLDEQLHTENVKSEIASLMKQRSDLKNNIQMLRSELKKREEELKRRDATILQDKEEAKARKLELERLQQAVYGASATIDAMQATLSWQITRPLRRVRRSLKTETAEESKRHISVVLPIYRDTAMTTDCIESALPGILAVDGARLVLINDASPEVDMQAALTRIVAQYSNVVTLLSNETNLGFVASVNRGMKAFPDTDVVLLNSDVLLPDDTWLARLAEDAYTTNDIASVTPLSNNTTICTFPEFLQDNPLPFGLTVSEVDRAFCGEKYDCVEAPTGVGFCMYIRRKALDVVGYFDEETFGRGYGEENDFCQHAIRLGFRNVISPNLYVYHLGGVSFGEDKQALTENASRIIAKRYPSYHTDVQAFVVNDSLREPRIYRLAKLIANTDLPKILHVSHGTGGGVEQYVEELAEAQRDKAISLRLVPEGDKNMVKFSFAVNTTSDSIYFDLSKEYKKLVNLLKELGVGLLHYQHTLGVSETLFSLAEDLGVNHIFTLHDFYTLGGNPTLCNEKGIYPGEYDEALDNSPLYSHFDKQEKREFRTRHQKLLESAQLVIFPSQSTKDIFSNHYHFQQSKVIPHLECSRGNYPPDYSLPSKSHYVIGIFGAIGLEKGAELIEEMATVALRKKLPIKFIIIGYAFRSLKNVEVTGPFDRNQLVELSKQHEVDIAFFSSRCPETYSYTLSYALEAGLPIFAPLIGAFPERLKGRPLTGFFDYLDSAENITQQLCQFIDENKGKSADEWDIPNSGLATQFYLEGEYLSYVSQPKTANTVFLPSKVIDVGKKASGNLSFNEKLVVKIWKIYTHPSMRWINWLVPFRLRRGLKRLLSRQAIHDLVNKHEEK